MTSILKKNRKGDWSRSDSLVNNGFRISITAKLVLSFLLFIVMTSAIFTAVGIYIISDHIKADAQEQAREDLESARARVAELESQDETLKKENQRLSKTETLKWFLAGGGVLLVGWIIGMISRKSRKKRSSLL